MPKWTDQFSEAGLVEFLEVAKKEGIRVEGSAVHAIGIMEQRDRERDLLAEYIEAEEEGEREVE